MHQAARLASDPATAIFAAMRTTASYDLFPDAPSERAMARARYLAREGRVADAEKAYRDVLREHPDLKSCWAECFELLRSHGRTEDALRLAEGARAQFGDSAFALALKGAALIDLERYREALGMLERALEFDPDLAVVWHELGYAAFRLGDRNRALLALDRAFALEPHTETLRLRGRILRDGGRYQAAEVAYEGAAQAAEHREQREAAERDIAATRRYAFYAPRRPDALTPAERWFAETGTVVLAPDEGRDAPDDAALAAAFLDLAHDSGWHFGQIVALGRCSCSSIPRTPSPRRPRPPTWSGCSPTAAPGAPGKSMSGTPCPKRSTRQPDSPGAASPVSELAAPPAPRGGPRDRARQAPDHDVREIDRRQPVRARREPHQPRPVHAAHPDEPVPRSARGGAGADGRRTDRGVHRVPHPTQRRARPLQGRHSLPSRRRPRRGAGLGDDHDVEDRAHGHSVRRCQGRRHRGPEAALQTRARAPHPSLHAAHLHRAGPLPGHPRSRRQHQPPGHGVDPRRVLEPPWLLPGRGHRQADLPRGVAGP